ncbi:hypothetical protein Tco_0435743 [Tanacetum coccineum]
MLRPIYSRNLGIWDVYFSRWRIHGVILLTVLQTDEWVDKEQLASNNNASECSISSTTSTKGSRFVTVIKQSKEIDTISYHKLFDILKQYQNEVNDIRSERLAKSANPLALIAAVQPYSNHYYQAPKSQRSNAQALKQSSSTRPKDKGYAKEFGFLAKYFSSTTNHNQQQPSNSSKLREPYEDTTPRGRQGSAQIGIRALNTMDWALCKDAGAKANFEVLPKESSSTDQPLKQVQNNDENNVFANERQHSEKNATECTDERDALANLIANLTLDTEENKTILKQLNKVNASLTQELKRARTNLDEDSNKHNELEKYIAFNDQTIDYDILQTKLNETLGLLARKDIDIKEDFCPNGEETVVLKGA